MTKCDLKEEIEMGLKDFIKKQFIDILQWNEDSDGVMAWRYPMQDFEIQYGGQLVVRESQMAVFVNEGKIADVFGPGTHTLTTKTLPVITYLKNWDKLFASPFKSDVYFFSTRLQLGRRWGTQQPITVRDSDFGAVKMRAFGVYSYRISDPRKFFTDVSGTRESYTVDEVEQQLRNQAVANLAAAFGGSAIPFLDMAANQGLLGDEVKKRLDPVFEGLGLSLASFVVESVSLPDDLQEAMNKKIAVGMMKGSIEDYTKLQIADAIPIAAANEGGMAGLGAQLATGFAIGGQMAQGFGQAMVPAGAAPAPAAVPAPVPPADDPTARLEKLSGMLAKGLITQGDFDSAKAEIIKRLIG